MGGRIYSVTWDSSQSVALDFDQINPPDDVYARLLAVYIAQSTELGDDEEEILRVRVVRDGSDGSGGFLPTPVPLHPRTPAAQSTTEARNTTQSTGTDVVYFMWNVRDPLALVFPPDCIITGRDRLAVGLMTAPADSMWFTFTAVFEER
jgi:hypothetical protein